jgi:hypothetical protein
VVYVARAIPPPAEQHVILCPDCARRSSETAVAGFWRTTAFNITSCTVIARSHAASGYVIEPPARVSSPSQATEREAVRSLALGSGQIMYSLHADEPRLTMRGPQNSLPALPVTGSALRG